MTRYQLIMSSPSNNDGEFNVIRLDYSNLEDAIAAFKQRAQTWDPKSPTKLSLERVLT